MIAAAKIEHARAVRIEDEIVRRGITLKRVGAELIGPCPVCGGRDRFGINVRKQVFNCRGCGGKGDVIALVQIFDDCQFTDAIATLVGEGDRANVAPPPKPATSHMHQDERRNLILADATWRAATPLGSEAVAYFANRGIDINAVPDHGGLRFYGRCPWGGGTTPCIIGRFTTALGNEPRGIWRRPLTGEKPMTLGPIAGCIIRLWPDEAVERGLVLGEGVETVLAAATRIVHRGTLLQPAWGAGGAGNVKKFPVLPGVEALTLLVDNDLPDQRDLRAGQDAAAECAARWSAAGREVTRLTPKVLGADFNDVVMRHGT
jgi:phage/plasmid primase-like uncharacterized protein